MQLICIMVALLAYKGTANQLRATTTVLTLVRTAWYGFIGLGLVSVRFQAFSWAQLLYNVIALVSTE
jgi:hypothetical protein